MENKETTTIEMWLDYNWLKLLAIAFLFGTFGNFPYVYFQLTNWFVAGAALMTARQAHQQVRTVLMWLFIFIAVVFNPIAPLYLSKYVWQIADILVILLFIISFNFIKSK